MTDFYDEFEAEFKLLKESYLRRLPSKLACLCETWEVVVASAGGKEVWKEFYLQVHSLSGTGATYGFYDLSAIAQTLEQVLKPLVLNPTAPTQAQQTVIESLLQSLEQQILHLAAS